MIWGIVSLILLLVVIGLTIWLLVRQSGSCPTKKKLNESCDSTSDCNSGLVCSAGSGSSTSTSTSSTDTTKTCKVAFGGTCSESSECASGQVCQNGICTIRLGTGGQPCPCEVGFTCINNVCLAVAGQPCSENSQCATGMCQNGICVCENSSNTSCWTDSSCRTDSSSDSSFRDSSFRNSFRDSSFRKSSKDFYTCTDTDCSKTKYSYHDYDFLSDFKKNSSYESSSDDCSYDSSRTSSRHSSRSSFSRTSSDDCSTDSYSSSDCHRKKYIRKGVYVTTPNNTDSTLFTTVDKPIIDIAKFGSGFLLLLSNGDLVSGNTTLKTNKKMFRIVRFGTEIVGLSRKGKLYSRNSSNSTTWTWERLTNYPSNVIFIDSTNTWNNLEVLTCDDKAFVYTFSSNWKNGSFTTKRREKDFRYYGKDLNRYIDIDQRTNIGKTNDSVKYKCVKAAGFYNSGDIVQVLVDDTFTHVRIIDNKAYFLFEQHC